MSRQYSDLQMLRNQLPIIPDGEDGQAVLNVISWMYENAVGDIFDGLYDAIASAYVGNLFDFGSAE